MCVTGDPGLLLEITRDCVTCNENAGNSLLLFVVVVVVAVVVVMKMQVTC